MLETFKPMWSGQQTVEQAARAIIHGMSVEQYRGHVPQFLQYQSVDERLAASPLRVLDFGCGLGRFGHHVGSRYPNWQILGYDCPAMVENAAKLWDFTPNVGFTSDWQRVLEQKFDLINAEIVLMHVLEPDVRKYLRQFKTLLGPNCLGFFHATREVLDDERTNIWDIVFDEGWSVARKYYGEFRTGSPVAQAAALLLPN